MKLSTAVLLALLFAARVSSAQTPTPQDVDESSPLNTLAAAAVIPPAPADTAPLLRNAFRPATPSLFRSMRDDLGGFFSTDTAKVLGVFAIGGLAARTFDRASVEDTSEHLSKGAANVGNWGGSFYVQTGSAFAAYAIGRGTGNQRLASIGGDLFRAQMLSELFVEGTKLAVGRRRPDGSNSQSFPSGHSASAFATATVLQQHLGWKIGVPAYTFAAFVGASRMASNKHYLSDVIVGAGIGIAVGRTVTLHLGSERFALGAAPTQGGAMVTFTRR